MTDARFVQIHTLHSYPAALLNRDDSGLAKRIPYGGVVRTRISPGPGSAIGVLPTSTRRSPGQRTHVTSCISIIARPPTEDRPSYHAP